MPGVEQEDVFVATVTSVRPLASMLRALSFRAKAVVSVRENGIKLTVEEGRSIQANAYLQASTFATYIFHSPASPPATPSPSHDEDDEDRPENPDYLFTISLSTLLECLNIFGNAGGGSGWSRTKAGGGEGTEGHSSFRRKSGAGDDEKAAAKEDSKSNTSMRMSYAGQGYPLVLLLEESGTVTRCEITTYEPDDLMDLPFDDDSRVQKLIMKSEWLHDAFGELDPSSEKLTIHFSPPTAHAPTPYNRYPGGRKKRKSDAARDGEDEEPEVAEVPIFRIESHGALGSTQMDYPNDRDVLETYECHEMIRNSYKFSHIQLTSKALASSTKTSIRTAEDGLISFQFMIPLAPRAKAGEGKDGFVEFLCVPLDED